MLNNTNQKHAYIAAVAAICMMAGLVRADDGGNEDYMIPAAYVTAETESAVATCKDLAEAAWFGRELERTDGDVSPQAPQVACRAEIYAESTVDAD